MLFDIVISPLQRAGAEFPKSSESSAPLFNGQSQAARNMRSPDQQDEAESSAANDFPALRCAFLFIFIVCFGAIFLYLFSLLKELLICFITVSYYNKLLLTVMPLQFVIPRCKLDFGLLL